MTRGPPAPALSSRRIVAESVSTCRAQFPAHRFTHASCASSQSAARSSDASSGVHMPSARSNICAISGDACAARRLWQLSRCTVNDTITSRPSRCTTM